MNVLLYYLIENTMGFETPIAEGGRGVLEEEKKVREKRPVTKTIYSGKNEILLKARYYLVPKDVWDERNCPLIPVDFS